MKLSYSERQEAAEKISKAISEDEVFPDTQLHVLNTLSRLRDWVKDGQMTPGDVARDLEHIGRRFNRPALLRLVEEFKSGQVVGPKRLADGRYRVVGITLYIPVGPVLSEQEERVRLHVESDATLVLRAGAFEIEGLRENYPYSGEYYAWTREPEDNTNVAGLGEQAVVYGTRPFSSGDLSRLAQCYRVSVWVGLPAPSPAPPE